MVARKAASVSAALIVILVAAGVLVCLYSGPNARIPIHFNRAGAPNGWATPERAGFYACITPVVIWCVFLVLPYIDLRGRNLVRSEHAYGTVWVALTAYFCASGANVLAQSFGAGFPPIRLHLVLLGGLLIVLGNVMGKVRWNYTFGIRTPWTLADERIWDKTHRFGGWALVAGGVFLLAAGLIFAQLPPVRLLVIPTILLIALAVTLKSYLLWRTTNSRS
jgi:immunity protein, SdpI family